MRYKWTLRIQRYCCELWICHCVLGHVTLCLSSCLLYSEGSYSCRYTLLCPTLGQLIRWPWGLWAFSAWNFLTCSFLPVSLWPAFSPLALTWADLSGGLSIWDHEFHLASLPFLVRAVSLHCCIDQWSAALTLTLCSLSCTAAGWNHWVLATAYESAVVFWSSSFDSLPGGLLLELAPRHHPTLASPLTVVKWKRSLWTRLLLARWDLALLK